MARAAILGRLTWQPATVAAVRAETTTAATLVLAVDGWAGHVPGQHADIRLTAPDGYTAHRSYSISSAPSPDRLEVTVQAVAGGEVSPYLVDTAAPGDQLEIRGPLGGWFLRPSDDPRPALLIGGGSGIAPLMSMVRAATQPTRMLYSVRSPSTELFTADLAIAQGDDDGCVDVARVYTRVAPAGSKTPPRRLDADDLTRVAWPRDTDAVTYVCGPTGFVETVADLLVDIGIDPMNIRTERFGPTGGYVKCRPPTMEPTQPG